MNREQLIQLCQQAPKIGAVSHEEFVDYISVLDQVRRVDGQWQKHEAAYMNVDGKIAMANEDHRRQQKRLIFEDPVVLVDNDQQLTLMVTIESELYGRRHGIATSRRVGGSSYEAAHPWEVAETSGVLPGSGLASADDVSRAQEADGSQNGSNGSGERRGFQPVPSNGTPRRGRRAVSAFQRQKIHELFTSLYPGYDADKGIDALFQREVGYGIDEATYDEGRQVTAYLLREKRRQQDQTAVAT